MVQGTLITLREEHLLGIDRTDGSTLALYIMDKKIVRTVHLLGVPVKKKIGVGAERPGSATLPPRAAHDLNLRQAARGSRP